jgi:hypothetical protein
MDRFAPWQLGHLALQNTMEKMKTNHGAQYEIAAFRAPIATAPRCSSRALLSSNYP